jgi:hypothetical protein
MLLILHIIIAISSLVYTGYIFITPSPKKLHIAYAFVAGTVISGIGLLLQKPTAMAQVCITGLTYLAFVSLGIFAARHKLAAMAKIKS